MPLLSNIRIKIAIVFLLNFAVCSAQKINFEHLSVEHGLSQLSVMSIYQDEFGRMWFGTQGGLSCYDGFRFKSFLPNESTNSIPGNIVEYITGDKKGSIYFTCESKFVKYDMVSEHFTTFDLKNVMYISKSNDILWILTKSTIYQYDLINYKLKRYSELPKNNFYTAIYETKNGKLLIGSTTALYLVSDVNNFIPLLNNTCVHSVFEDSKKNIWVATRNKGLFRTDENLIKFNAYQHLQNDNTTLSIDYVRTVCEDGNGTIWVGTFAGLNKLDGNTGKFTCYTHSSFFPKSISHSSVYSMLCDDQGTMWAGTYYGGVSYFNPDINVFNFYSLESVNAKSISFPYVGKIVEDEKNNLWIATEGGGLNYLNRQTGIVTQLIKSNSEHVFKNIKALLFDKINKKLYIGYHEGGLDIMDTKNQNIKHYPLRIGNEINESIVYSLGIYNNTLYIGLFSRLVTMSTNSNSSPEFNDNDIILEYSKQRFFDSRGNLWYHPYGRPYISRYNMITKKTDNFKYLFDNNNDNNHSIIVSSIMEDQDHNIWFSTLGSGIFLIKQNNKLINYRAQTDGLLSNYCYALAQSKYGDILISNRNGLSRFNKKTNNFKNIKLSDGVPLTSINDGCGLFVASNGEIFWGGVNGLVSFYEQQISNLSKPTNIYFSEIDVNNKKVNTNDASRILDKSLLYSKSIKLKSTDSNIIIYFSTSNHIKENAVEYEYSLDGVNDQWLKCTDNRVLLTNLSSGEYKLTVRGRSLNSNLFTNTIELTINVLPPFYASNFALFIYLLLIITASLFGIRFYKRDFILKTSLEYEKKENSRIEEENQSKLRFFTNISHEFRTPITLIVGQIESLFGKKETLTTSSKLVSIYKNATKLNNLLTELLDFRKQEQGFLKIKVDRINIVEFVREIYMAFNDFAFVHKITYQFNCSETDIQVWFDPLQLQKVFNNLLSNAFKFTKAGGHISISIEPRLENLEIRVSDTGVGIPQKDIDSIFNSFYQANNDEYFGGTGIGLALAKGIVDLHGGQLSVKSEFGNGSDFIVILKYGDAHLSPDQKIDEGQKRAFVTIDNVGLPDDIFFSQVSAEFVNTSNEKNYSVLIVEDNEEIKQLLVSAFNSLYNVESASNGKEGFDKAVALQPDIILTDVMMPQMSGSEMLTKLKSTIDTCHIPIVMLTANTSEQYMIQGLQFGADDYITKPFNMKHLIIRCNNLVRNRKMLQEKYTNQKINSVELVANNTIDQGFIETINHIIEDNLDQTGFTVDRIAASMNVGRNKIYSKIKGITGLSPNDYIQKYKLQRASFWLTNNPEFNISDITYKLGFGNPHYFSKCFKEMFNVAPLTYRKNKGIEKK